LLYGTAALAAVAPLPAQTPRDPHPDARLRLVAEARQLGPVGYRDPLGVMAPDGRWLAYVSQGRLVLVQLAGGPLTFLGPPVENVFAIAWQPDARRVAALTQEEIRGLGPGVSPFQRVLRFSLRSLVGIVVCRPRDSHRSPTAGSTRTWLVASQPTYIPSMPQPVYLDHAATTPVRTEVFEAMEPFFGPRFGNPSSTHRWGREARAALDEARERVATCLGAHPDEIAFTSGGTEADNLSVLGLWRALRSGSRTVVVSSPIEHKAILAAVHQAGREGAEERYARVGPTGVIDRAHYDALVDEQVALVTLMWVNNEIGVVQPVQELCQRAKERGAFFHTDAVQAFGKLEIDARRTPFDLLTISGHKIGAPKGIGAVYIRRGTPLEPMLFGGSQDHGRRPGTENVAAAVGLARAAELAVAEREHEVQRLGAMRDALEAALVARIPDVVVHARGAERAPHILNISVPGTDSDSLLMALDMAGVACSAGSACQSGSVSPSHVLSALGVRDDLASAAVRMSFGSLSTGESVARVAELFPALIAKARRLAGASAA
jgi:cysteine desulfurase